MNTDINIYMHGCENITFMHSKDRDETSILDYVTMDIISSNSCITIFFNNEYYKSLLQLQDKLSVIIDKLRFEGYFDEQKEENHE